LESIKITARQLAKDEVNPAGRKGRWEKRSDPSRINYRKKKRVHRPMNQPNRKKRQKRSRTMWKSDHLCVRVDHQGIKGPKKEKLTSGEVHNLGLKRMGVTGLGTNKNPETCCRRKVMDRKKRNLKRGKGGCKKENKAPACSGNKQG